MSSILEQLEQQLKERIEALDKQRQEETVRFEAEKEAWRSRQSETAKLIDFERRQKFEEAERADRKRVAEIEEQKRELAKRERNIEIAHNAAQEAKRQQEERLEWLKNEIAKQEFAEEQYRKRLETTLIAAPEAVEDATINVEHPIAPDNKGNAVVGTEGSTPENNLMSHHLKHILRQAARM
jgi:DNA repair exonuclease SbcCD ATPase subunit